MKWRDLFQLSVSNLKRRKLRTSLTLIGVMIGTASIVSMMSIGLAISYNLQQSLVESDNLTVINVRRSYEQGYIDESQLKKSDLSDPDKKLITDDAVEILKDLPGIEVISPVLEMGVVMKVGNKIADITLRGMSEEAIKTLNYKVVQGEDIDFSSQEFQLLLGKQATRYLYNPNSRGMEEEEQVELDIEPYSFYLDSANYHSRTYGDQSSSEEQEPLKRTIIVPRGIISSGKDSASSMYKSIDSQILVEFEALKRKLKEVFKNKPWPNQPSDKNNRPYSKLLYSSIFIRCTDLDATKNLVQEIKALGYEPESDLEFVEHMRKQMATQQMVLGGIGAISLLVAAIGIANTMMMTIYERTREIGIFKVLGCRLHLIRRMFLIESALIGLIGGVLGIILSFIVSSVLNSASSGAGAGEVKVYISYIPFWLAVLAVGFASLIGIVAGILPANRAMRLSALEALRTN